VTGPLRPIDRNEMDANQSKKALLRALPLFRSVADDVVERLAAYSRITRHARGDALFRKGDDGAGLVIVMSGGIKVVLPSAEGHEIVLNVIGPGEVVGEIALLDGQPRTADCIALAATETLSLDRRDFLPLLQSRPEVALAMIDVLCERLRKTSSHVENLVFSDPEVRLARAVLDLSGRILVAGSRRIVMTQQQLGTMIGLSRESTNKILRRWEKGGAIVLSKGGLEVIDAGPLKRLAATDV
jgi:CRP/FNR family transcriptional regulator, cyclic AMP receptor protein